MPRVFSFWASIPSWSGSWLISSTWINLVLYYLKLRVHVKVDWGHKCEETDWCMIKLPWSVNCNLNIISHIPMRPLKGRGDILREGKVEWKLVAAHVNLCRISVVAIQVLLNIQISLLIEKLIYWICSTFITVLAHLLGHLLPNHKPCLVFVTNCLSLSIVSSSMRLPFRPSHSSLTNQLNTNS